MPKPSDYIDINVGPEFQRSRNYRISPYTFDQMLRGGVDIGAAMTGVPSAEEEALRQPSPLADPIKLMTMFMSPETNPKDLAKMVGYFATKEFLRPEPRVEHPSLAPATYRKPLVFE